MFKNTKKLVSFFLPLSWVWESFPLASTWSRTARSSCVTAIVSGHLWAHTFGAEILVPVAAAVRVAPRQGHSGSCGYEGGGAPLLDAPQQVGLSPLVAALQVLSRSPCLGAKPAPRSTASQSVSKSTLWKLGITLPLGHKTKAEAKLRLRPLSLLRFHCRIFMFSSWQFPIARVPGFMPLHFYEGPTLLPVSRIEIQRDFSLLQKKGENWE